MRVNTRDQIWKLPDILEHFSRYIPIEPGDMFSTGAPGGVAVGKPNAAELFLKPGDVVECGIEGFATLRTTIVEPATGARIDRLTLRPHGACVAPPLAPRAVLGFAAGSASAQAFPVEDGHDRRAVRAGRRRRHAGAHPRAAARCDVGAERDRREPGRRQRPHRHRRRRQRRRPTATRW